jgi:lipoyl(octanoyl) transferase
MAVDEALLESMGSPEAIPVLRLYAWEPPCLSLGVAQPVSDVIVEDLRSRGWELVRRPTGGRAILHTDELTYSVISPQSEPRLWGSVLESYQRLSEAILEALQQLDIPARSEARPALPGGSDPKGPVCFEVPSNYEITVDGKKLVGSAQARRKEGILQHGSLPLYGDLARITQVLVLKSKEKPAEPAPGEASARLRQRATTVEQCLGQIISWESAAQAFSAAFQKVLNLQLLPDDLTHQELERAAQLVRDKYDHPSWTNRI